MSLDQQSAFELGNVPSREEAVTLVRRMSAQFDLTDSTPRATEDDKVLKIATFSLQKYLKEPAFASEFLERGGLESLSNIINSVSGNTLAYALKSFTSLMDHDLISGFSLGPNLIARIGHICVSETLVTICRPATEILIKIVSAENSTIADAVTPETTGYETIYMVLQKEPNLLSALIQHLQSPDYALALNSLTLLNRMLRHVPNKHRSELLEGISAGNTHKHVLRIMDNQPPEELKAQVLEFQSALVYNADQQRNTQVSICDPRHAKMLDDMWEIAHLDEGPLGGTDRWRRLGFTSEMPHREFGNTGVLGLEKMHTFAVQNPDYFAKIILQQLHRPEDKRCPFAKANIEAMELLCAHWDINSGYSATSFDPLLLQFDLVYTTTVQCFMRLFQDMEATVSDFPKVSALTRSQLRATLITDGIKDVYEFERIMLNTPYSVIRDRRLKELEWADDLLGREAIRNLRSRLNKQSYEFIRRQRINCLLQGAWFPCPQSTMRIVTLATGIPNTMSGNGQSSNGPLANPLNTNNSSGSVNTARKRWRYYKLSPSKKILQFGDFADKNPVVIKSYECLPNKVDLSLVSEIKSYHRKSSTALTLSISSLFETTSKLSFRLLSDEQVPLAEFICSSSAQASEWRDGFSMLLDQGITSKDTAEYLHSLTEIGVKIKLLQVAGDRVEIPHKHPDVPTVPAGLGSGFFYDSK
ncbi:ELMO/CED-12 family-domain-containing protein [Dichotomocladium elegans]|nr:ELMO/CED-12 family-domain-containing protein [Dichotomocladium elegans]